VEIPSRGSASASPTTALALLIGDGPGVESNPVPVERFGAERPGAGWLSEAVRSLRARVPSLWAGVPELPAEGGPAPSAAAGPPELPSPDGPVSQGAYVPRARYLENLPSRWWFAAERCGACGTTTFPTRGRCRQCGARDGLETVRLPRDGGEVVASTTIGPGGQPTEFDPQVAATGSYGVVLVELTPGVRVTLQVTDAPPGALGIGAHVATRLRRLYAMEGEWRYGRKAVPLPGK
jgi:uncharacterized OB-fold protein